jgi:hypothetical protein
LLQQGAIALSTFSVAFPLAHSTAGTLEAHYHGAWSEPGTLQKISLVQQLRQLPGGTADSQLNAGDLLSLTHFGLGLRAFRRDEAFAYW